MGENGNEFSSIDNNIVETFFDVWFKDEKRDNYEYTKKGNKLGIDHVFGREQGVMKTVIFLFLSKNCYINSSV